MGLTIHYSLHRPGRDVVAARSVIERLHHRASELPFQSVGPVVELSGESCDFNNCEPDDPNRWLLIQARQLLLPSHVEVKPTKVLAFSAYPGLGSEPANIGLCLYPAAV